MHQVPPIRNVRVTKVMPAYGPEVCIDSLTLLIKSSSLTIFVKSCSQVEIKLFYFMLSNNILHNTTCLMNHLLIN